MNSLVGVGGIPFYETTSQHVTSKTGHTVKFHSQILYNVTKFYLYLFRQFLSMCTIRLTWSRRNQTLNKELQRLIKNLPTYSFVKGGSECANRKKHSLISLIAENLLSKPIKRIVLQLLITYVQS